MVSRKVVTPNRKVFKGGILYYTMVIEIQDKGYGFEEQEQQANEDLSLILNPHNAYKRTQEDILKEIFK